MLVGSLVRSTVELQGFRVAKVTGDTWGLEAELAADGRYALRCGHCGHPAPYRDRRPLRRFRHVPLWGIPVNLSYAPRRVSCVHCRGGHVEALPRASGKKCSTKALMVTPATWTPHRHIEQLKRYVHRITVGLRQVTIVLSPDDLWFFPADAPFRIAVTGTIRKFRFRALQRSACVTAKKKFDKKPLRVYTLYVWARV